MDSVLDSVFLFLIDKDGEVYKLEKKDFPNFLKDHNEAYSKFEHVTGQLNEKEKEKLNLSRGGYEKANAMAASGYVVVWPADINNPQFVVVTLPEVLSVDQARVLSEYADHLYSEDYIYFISKSASKNIRSQKIINTTIAQEIEFDEFKEKISEITGPIMDAALTDEDFHI